MAEQNEHEDWLSAAECAARTGLTVRALHVYERYGLITPRRTDKGWRLYGRLDMARLNIITALKAVGLSLSQIQDIIRASPPSLERVLEIQVQTWSARKAEAEHGLALAEAALAQLQARQSLAMEDLCDLILSFEGTGLRKIIDEVIEDQFTSDELQSLAAWTKENWPDGEEHIDAFVKSRAEAWKLVTTGAAPSSSEAQAMIDRMMSRERELSVFERVRAGTGSIVGAAKGQAISKAMVERMNRDPASKDRLAVELFIDSARQVRLEQSKEWSQFVRASGLIVAETHRLIEIRADPGSPEVRGLLGKFAELGQIFKLGDPVFYALWAHEKGPARKDLWEFIGQVERAHRVAGN